MSGAASKALEPSLAEKPPRHVLLAEGARIGGQYVVEGVLGEGAHSVVYRARREKRGDVVALKVIHRHLTGDRQIAQRFAREAAILRRLEGEHVARMLDFVEDDGLLAIALELVEGVSLEAMLAERAPLDLEVAIEISLQVCAALGAAHANGIVHRDLTTANVLVERMPPPKGGGASPVRVKVVDFGLGKVLQGDHDPGLTEQGMIFGTPEYMAPEQARGEEVDARADLYAAGVMLYEMTVGAPPFSGRTAVRTMTAHLREAPPSPRAMRPEAAIPASLEAVILRALAKNPADRFGSARELAQAIAAARDEPRVIAPHAVHDPDAIATSDTDLNLPPPSFANARTLPAHQLPRAEAIVAAASSRTSRPPPPTQPSPRAEPARADADHAGRGIVEETTMISGAAPSKRFAGMRLAWAVIALVAAAIGVALGVIFGTR